MVAAGALSLLFAASGAAAQSLRLGGSEKVAPVSNAKIDDLALKLQVVEDATERRAVRASLETNLAGIQVRARQAVFSDFVSGRDNSVSDPLVSRSELQVERELSPATAPKLSFGGGLAHETYASGASTIKANGRVATQLFDRPVANTVRWTLTSDGETPSHELVDGTLLVQERFGPARLRASLSYEGAPSPDVISYGLAGDLPLATYLLGRFGIEHLYRDDRGMAYSLGINLGGPRLAVGASMRYVDDGEYRVVMALALR